MTTPPIDQFRQYAVSQNPSGSRHLDAGGFIKVLNIGAGGHLDFGDIDTTTSGSVSATKLLVWRPSSFGDASGIFNAKFYLKNTSAFGGGTYRFLYRINKDYLGATFTLNTSDGDVPTTLAAAASLPPTSGTAYTQTNDDGVSQYIYLAIFADQDVNTEVYGGPSQGTFRYRVTYDWS